MSSYSEIRTDGGQVEKEFPKRYDWEEYYTGHGVEIRRRFVALENDAYWRYRAKHDDVGITVVSDSAEDALSRMIQELVNDE